MEVPVLEHQSLRKWKTLYGHLLKVLISVCACLFTQKHNDFQILLLILDKIDNSLKSFFDCFFKQWQNFSEKLDLCILCKAFQLWIFVSWFQHYLRSVHYMDIPAHGTGIGTRWPLRSLPTWAVLWFFGCFVYQSAWAETYFLFQVCEWICLFHLCEVNHLFGKMLALFSAFSYCLRI